MGIEFERAYPQSCREGKLMGKIKLIETFTKWLKRQGYEIVRIEELGADLKFSAPDVTIADLILMHLDFDLEVLKAERKKIAENFTKG